MVAFGLLAYNFIQASWTAPTATPPGGNTDRPINVGSIYQAKSGDLGAIRMRAGQYCNAAGTKCVTADGLIGGGSGQAMAIGRVAMTVNAAGNLTVGTVTFDKPFDKVPKVVASVQDAYYNGPCRGDEIIFRVNVRSVSRTGFVVEAPYATGGCGTRRVVGASWIALADGGANTLVRTFSENQMKNAVKKENPSVATADAVHDTPGNRAALCESLFPGSSPTRATTGSFTSPSNNTVYTLSGFTVWTRAGASGRNVTLTSLECTR